MRITDIPKDLSTLERETLVSDGEFRVDVKKILTDSEIQQTWQALQDGFAAINSKSLHKQDMTREEFEDDINDGSVLKYLVYKGSENVAGYLSVHIGLDKVTWTDNTLLQDVQDATDSHATPYYISTFVVPPSMQGLQLGGLLLKAALIHFEQTNISSGKQSLVFFDCAETNYPAIPDYAKRVCAELSTQEKVLSVSELYVTEESLGHTALVDVIEEVPKTLSEKQHFFSLSMQ